MTKRMRVKLVHEGKYVAEVQVDVEYDDTGWSPYLSVDDAYKLDDVRDALREGDVEAASRLASVYTLTPVAV
jgi:uncharacterized membrane-anchored protein